MQCDIIINNELGGDVVIENDLLNRYIKELTKYMTYENAQVAKKDLLEIINDELGPYYELEELAELLEDLGSPYSLSVKYDRSSNFLISGRNYKIYTSFLKIVNLLMAISLATFFLTNGFNNLVEFLEILKINLLTIIIGVTLASFIAEKVKSTRIIQSMLSEFKVKYLYEKKKMKFEKITLINFVVCNLIYFYMLPQNIIVKNELLVKIIQLSLFLIALRDSNRVSEVEIGKYVSVLSLIVDIILIILATTMIKLGSGLTYGLYIVLTLQILDLLYIAKENILNLGEVK